MVSCQHSRSYQHKNQTANITTFLVSNKNHTAGSVIPVHLKATLKGFG
jgi:hypothetical protein